MSFLVVENLDNADQVLFGRDFVRKFDVMIDLNNGLISIRNPNRKYLKKPINIIIKQGTNFFRQKSKTTAGTNSNSNF